MTTSPPGPGGLDAGVEPGAGGVAAETVRLAALTALRDVARDRDDLAEKRACGIVAAWRAGEHSVTELARAAGVSRTTVLHDLQRRGIDPSAHSRGADAVARRGRPSAAAVDYERVVELAAQLSAALTPSGTAAGSALSAQPEPLTRAGWMVKKLIAALGALQQHPDPGAADAGAGPPERREDLLGEVVACTEVIQQAAHTTWASQASPAELARHTDNDAVLNAAERGVLTSLTATLLLATGLTVTATISTAGNDAEIPGWTLWSSDAPLELAPIDGALHLEIQALLARLRGVISDALHPGLFEDPYH